jgi:hypothetical protein
MTEDQVYYVAQSVREIVEHSRRVPFVALGASAQGISPRASKPFGSSEGNL